MTEMESLADAAGAASRNAHAGYLFLSGVARGYENAMEYITPGTVRENLARKHIQAMAGIARRMALKAKTRGVIEWNKVLRENK